MSASKKKQQRREAVDTEKVTQAQAEQAAYKKKVRLYTIIGIVIAVLVVVLLVWNSGIFQKNATAATIGEEEMTVAELSYYYYDIRQTYAMYGLVDSTLDDANTVFNAEEGTTYQDFFLESALSDAQSFYALYAEAMKAGYSDADVQADVDAQIETLKATASSNGYDYKSFLKAVYGRYVTPSIVKECLTREAVANLYYSDLSSAKLDSLTAEELDAYYAANPDKVDTVTYSYLYFRAEDVETTDENGEELSEDAIAALEEEALAAAKTQAEEALEFYQGGMEVSVLIEKTAPNTSADHTSVVGTEAVSSVFRDQLLELNAEDAAIVEQEGLGYYLVVFHDRSRNETPAADVRHILVNAETTTDESGALVAPTEEAWAAALAEIEQIKAEFEAGAQTSETFAALAEKYSDDAGSNTNGGLYEDVAEGYFVTEFNDWLFAEEGRNTGDTAVIRHEGNAETEQYPYWGYHLTYFENWGEAEWQLYIRELTTEEAMNEMMDGLYETYPAELASAASSVGK